MCSSLDESIAKLEKLKKKMSMEKISKLLEKDKAKRQAIAEKYSDVIKSLK